MSTQPERPPAIYDYAIVRVVPRAERADGTPATNLALDYLPGAVAFDPLAFRPDAELAS